MYADKSATPLYRDCGTFLTYQLSKMRLYNVRMIRQFTYRIEPEYDSFTIREYLSLKGYPNAVFVQLKKTPESVLLNGVWAYMRGSLTH